MRRQEEYQELEIVLVYPFPGHDERWDPKSRERLRHLKENCDQFVMGSKIVGAQGYRERTAYMVEHADCLVAVCDDEPAGPSGVADGRGEETACGVDPSRYGKGEMCYSLI